MGRAGRWRRLLPWGLAFACLTLPAAALGAFGDGSPTQPRTHTPNDPNFDRCELDDAEPPTEPTADDPCTSYFEEDFQLFGFSPDSAFEVPGLRTQYKDCDQLDAQGRAANIASGDPPCSQIAGIRADSAWKYSTGDPDTVVAILDTGIEWQNEELVDKVHLNREELPLPKLANGSDCGAYDCKPGGVPGFNVADYVDDPRVADNAGDTESDSILDPSDLIATFSNNADNDANGYVDDIAGWDFFDDDNDPFDASSCCNAEGHGSDRAAEAVAQANNQDGSLGICPECQLLPLRVWDTFVVPTDNFAMGVVYATDNDADVVEGAVGGLTNTRFARSSFTYADQHGVALTLVSSDINSANHNYPTNYNEAIYVGGSLPDTAPNDSCTGPGGIPFVGGSLPEADPPPEFTARCNAFLARLSSPGLPVPIPINPTATLQPPTTSFFRNANLTQYGGKADIVLVGSTGSVNTGQAAGAAALLESFAESELGSSLSGNETRQLLTMSAEDVRPLNTGTIGPADRANVGWDSHFGYGRVNLSGAMARITNDKATAPDLPCDASREDCIPPEAQIDSPDWFAPVNVDRLPATGLPVFGRAAAPHGTVGTWELEYACGQDAADADFEAFDPPISGTGATNGLLGRVPKELLVTLSDPTPVTGGCDGSVAADAGRPAGTTAEPWPANPYPSPDPERHAVQLRLTVHDAQDAANFGRYRKTIFPYGNDGNQAGWPRPLGSGSDATRLATGSGGEASPRLYDLDGDNELDVLQATSSGELHATHADGTPVAAFNGGQPVTTDRYALELNHPVPAGVVTPRESLRVPAIGDVDGDREAEIVDTAGEHVYVWSLDGEREQKIRLDPSFSEPCKPATPDPCFNAADRQLTRQNHLKRGFFGSPVLADLDGDDVLDIVATALDQRLYAFSGGQGEDLAGFPVKLEHPDADAGAEIITTPAIADLDGDDSNGPEIIVATNEVIGGDPQFTFPPLFELFSFVLQSATGSNPIYAVHGDGSMVSGWPVRIGIAAGDLLPLVLPGHDQAVLDADGDGDDEVSVSAATSLVAPGGMGLVDGDGSRISTYTNPNPNPLLHDQGPILNLADYQSVGDITGTGPSVVKGGLTPNGAVNLLAVNQNLPFNHVEQAWDPRTGAPIPGFPRATDDFQLLSQGAIARVAGSGPSRQILMGTGMYNLHAYDGLTGLDASGWPKFTGGWIQSTPAVGDADGDGKLDVSALTREGWQFLWSTDIDACADSNEEWWTYHHDERSTANYGTDGRPPGTVRDLTADPGAGGAVTVSWKAPGDDWLCGSPDRFRVIVRGGQIGSPSDGTVVADNDTTAATGDPESVSLSAAQIAGMTRVAVLYRDEAGNWGLLKSVALPAPGGGGTGGGGAGGGYYEECANVISGTLGKDKLKGTAGADRVRGRGGDDRIKGRAGDDCVSGQSGQDRINGGSGGDLIKGGRGRDRLSGGAGDDVIRARRGSRDRINCGAGEDTVFLNNRRDRARNCEKIRAE